MISNIKNTPGRLPCEFHKIILIFSPEESLSSSRIPALNKGIDSKPTVLAGFSMQLPRVRLACSLSIDGTGSTGLSCANPEKSLESTPSSTHDAPAGEVKRSDRRKCAPSSGRSEFSNKRETQSNTRRWVGPLSASEKRLHITVDFNNYPRLTEFQSAANKGESRLILTYLHRKAREELS